MANQTKTITYQVAPGGALQGTLLVPGDKSISHRAIMLGAIANGDTHVKGFLAGADCLATITAFRALGVKITDISVTERIIHGVGLHGLQPPTATLDLGNSGTSMRLLAGLLAGQKFRSTLTGDESLRRRPMARVVNPLLQMGAQITMQAGELPPLTINGNPALKAIDYTLPIASAQVKSALLLAGLYASGETCIAEPQLCRDHTERMLTAFDYPLQRQGHMIRLTGQQQLTACAINVPGDLSSAAFFIVAATIAANSRLWLPNVGINPTRTGILIILRAMGADIRCHNERLVNGEPVADLEVLSHPLHGIEIKPEWVPLAIDEFPIIFIAASTAKGRTVLRGAAELRVKESDRIVAMSQGLAVLGIKTTILSDGIEIEGQPHWAGGQIESCGDHRVAMAFAIAALRATQPITIRDCANVTTSFPDFPAIAQSVGLELVAEGYHQ